MVPALKGLKVLYIHGHPQFFSNMGSNQKYENYRHRPTNIQHTIIFILKCLFPSPKTTFLLLAVFTSCYLFHIYMIFYIKIKQRQYLRNGIRQFEKHTKLTKSTYIDFTIWQYSNTNICFFITVKY